MIYGDDPFMPLVPRTALEHQGQRFVADAATRLNVRLTPAESLEVWLRCFEHIHSLVAIELNAISDMTATAQARENPSWLVRPKYDDEQAA